MNTLKKPELLVPAGSLESLKTAILYGADAVYLGGMRFGLRAKARNFDADELKEGVAYAHAHGVRVHVTVNIVAHNDQLEDLPEYLTFLESIGVDALIVSDAGIIDLAREVVPSMEIHLSTQASATNYRTMNFWHRMGVKRIVVARELSLAEIADTREKTDPDLELEAFVHGAMCMSISGRCVLSNYLTGRDSNQGACTHPCRWKYALVEESRPGEYMPVMETERETYIFNSKDLCMIEYLPEMIRAGISSFKIEGRMKTPLYVAVTAKAYREAIDDLLESEEKYRSRIPYYKELLSKVSHRDYSTGFYLDRPDHDSYVYQNAQYVQQATFVGRILEIMPNGELLVEQRNKFSVGDLVRIVKPQGIPEAVKTLSIKSEDGEEQESAPHARQHVLVRFENAGEVVPGMLLMREKGQ